MMFFQRFFSKKIHIDSIAFHQCLVQKINVPWEVGTKDADR